MMAVTPINIKEDIDGLISELIGKGVCDDSNFSAIRTFGSKADVTSTTRPIHVSSPMARRPMTCRSLRTAP